MTLANMIPTEVAEHIRELETDRANLLRGDADNLAPFGNRSAMVVVREATLLLISEIEGKNESERKARLEMVQDGDSVMKDFKSAQKEATWKLQMLDAEIGYAKRVFTALTMNGRA